MRIVQFDDVFRLMLGMKRKKEKAPSIYKGIGIMQASKQALLLHILPQSFPERRCILQTKMTAKESVKVSPRPEREMFERGKELVSSFRHAFVPSCCPR